MRDYRAIKENVAGIADMTPRKRFKPMKVLPKSAAEPPLLIGVLPNYKEIRSLRIVEGRFFTAEEDERSAPVCVLGESAKVNLLGYEPGVGKYVKVNDVWLQVIGVMAQQAGADIVGANCGSGISDMVELARELRAATKLPLWIKPNAGKPGLVGGRTIFRETPEEMASRVPDLAKIGVSFIGGCCGTTPAHLAAIVAAVTRLR